MLSAFESAFVLVFMAEILGDKMLYTTATLSSRYESRPLAYGLVLGFMVKMAAAVAFGSVIAAVSRPTLLLMTAATFIVLIARFRHHQPEHGRPVRSGAKEAIAVSFGTIVFSEWGDTGQLTAATIAAHTNMPVVTWIAAVLAMTAKGALVIVLGATARRRLSSMLSATATRRIALSALVISGLLTLAEVAFR